MEIDNVKEKTRWVTHEYIINDKVYVEMNGIYRKLDCKKQGPYRIVEVFTNVTVWFQRGKVNERINIRRLNTHVNEYVEPVSLGP